MVLLEVYRLGKERFFTRISQHQGESKRLSITMWKVFLLSNILLILSTDRRGKYSHFFSDCSTSSIGPTIFRSDDVIMCEKVTTTMMPLVMCGC